MTFFASLGRFAGLSLDTGFKVADFFAISRQRNALAKLDDDALRDIGLTRSEAMTEAARPAWDVPSHWRN